MVKDAPVPPGSHIQECAWGDRPDLLKALDVPRKNGEGLKVSSKCSPQIWPCIFVGTNNGVHLASFLQTFLSF